MYLYNIDIVGFRGINRLSMQLRPEMVLIGENAWGKSSLLSALSLIFNPNKSLYQFTPDDFHLEYQADQDETRQHRHITLLFRFCEKYQGELEQQNTPLYQQVMVSHQPDQPKHIYLRVTGDWLENDNIITDYSFLDPQGETLQPLSKEKLVYSLISQHPVYRFRDAQLQQDFHQLSPLLLDQPRQPEQEKIQEEIRAVALLLRYYFLQQDQYRQLIHQLKDTSLLWQKAQSLTQKLQQPNSDHLKKRLFQALSSLFIQHKNIHFNKNTRPIILFEDLGANLHPRMMAIAWCLAQSLPIQRITTTNSVELLAQVELFSICRLVRYQSDTQAYQLTHHHINKEDLRRLNFHVHYNRSLALFARMWILVEGETEVWILSELAKLLDIHLDIYGIRLVEFAQSGLKPLIKYAKAMGIQWYVLTDGDDAGLKYAEIVKNMLPEYENASQRLTVLPQKDIEHFFYTQGFSQIFIRLARWQPHKNYYPTSKIIQRAIQRSSKPDLALALCAEMRKQGKNAIPSLFRHLFRKVLALTKEN
ncbi:ATP-dependent endonuclease [Volucribacter amazonae]|uniref:ATP-dependent endonuclease n=1 Tax=Volucribacter amazonae TaxID=256731 RepID=A0A9X4PAL3_9PAST|nr:ATP-dependent endonuclease [Volucribacter amazonae]MDG6894144.1 ATP-dependent endonuclease [Volucribacter amazonae]